MKIYLAGKITAHGWRESIVKELNGLDGSDMFSDWPSGAYMALHDGRPDEVVWPVQKNVIFGKHDYVGPYFIDCDHRCYHGRSNHGVGATTDGCDGREGGMGQIRTAMYCRSAIKDADLVFAWIDAMDAYGTIAELGYAHGLGKKIFIAIKKGLEAHDFWFVHTLCYSGTPASFDFGNPKDALQWYLSQAKNIPYAEYLQSPHWLAVRKSALERAANRCQVCGATSALQVHHVTYENLGAEKPEDLTVLCKTHHELFHKSTGRI